MKLKIGDKMPNFTVNTAFEGTLSLEELLGDNKTVLLFLRYAGCTLCRFDMKVLKNEYQKIKDKLGYEVIVVLQSDSNKLSKEISKDYYPYQIICDPHENLYKQLEIKPAASQEKMVGPGTMEKLNKVKMSGLIHGDYEGNELQLPAAFIVNKDLTVTYAHYATSVTDIPWEEIFYKGYGNN